MGNLLYRPNLRFNLKLNRIWNFILFLVQILIQPNYSIMKVCKIEWKGTYVDLPWEFLTKEKPSFSSTGFHGIYQTVEFCKVYVALVNIMYKL